MRHAAWLNAVPEPRQKSAGEQPRRKSRHDELKDVDIEPAMPPIEWGQYIVDYLFELGPTVPAGMGSGPLPPSEIEAAQRLLGIQFRPWEARLLLRLSREYLQESYRATDEKCSPPWDDPVVAQAEQMATARRLECSMQDLADD